MASPSPTQLIHHLQAGVASAGELMRALGISQASISRLTTELIRQNRVLRIGATRGARYALRRDVGSIGSSWPLYRIDAKGHAHRAGILNALAGNQYYFEAADESFATVAGLSHGLPYFLQDQRPAGFLGRNVPRLYPELELPQRVLDWTDDHYLTYLTRRGSDAVGDLILGAASMDLHLASERSRRAIEPDERIEAYLALAREALAGGLPGSSAHGENPKFATLIRVDGAPQQVLVKFSPTRDSAVGRRWSDLLVAEHLAHRLLESAGIPSCRSQVLQSADRTFLEMARFDRAGASGRIGVTSLHAVDTERYGRLDDWVAAGERLAGDRIIDGQSLERIRFLSAFGSLIANTDRHFGNLAFFDRYDGHLALAPAYDMLPMLFAPAHEQMVAHRFDPPTPTAQSLETWPAALALARRYWRALALDERVSDDFRAIAAECALAISAG